MLSTWPDLKEKNYFVKHKRTFIDVALDLIYSECVHFMWSWDDF